MDPVTAAIMSAVIGAAGSAASAKIGSNGTPGNDWNYKQHRQLWTERLRFNQDSFRARNRLADQEQRGDIQRRGMLRQFGRTQALADAGTSRNIRARDFTQGLGFKDQLFNQQFGFNTQSFTQQLGFNQDLFSQGQYHQGMALNTETAGRAGQRGVAERQRLEGMFPEASPWDLMGTGSAASAGQAVLPGYPSAQSAINAAGPSPSQQLRASEIASASKMAAMLLPTPAVQAAKVSAHAQMYSSVVHAMTGLAQSMINMQAPMEQAKFAGKRVGLESKKNPSEIELNAARSMEARQSGHEKSTRANINQEQASIARSEADHADRYYKGRADYEAERKTLGYGQLGVSGFGMVQANKLLNRLGLKFFGSSDNVTKKLSGARSIKSSASKSSKSYSKPAYSDGTTWEQQLWNKIGTGSSFQ